MKRTALEKWTYPKDYGGETYYDYYVGPGQSRDSDHLEKSNFETALEMLGGESDTVIVARAGHWAVGWVEQILVHQSDTAAVAKLEEIEKRLEGYPVLDDDDFTRREMEGYEEDYDNWARSDAIDKLGLREIEDDPATELDEEEEAKLRRVVTEALEYTNGDTLDESRLIELATDVGLYPPEKLRVPSEDGEGLVKPFVESPNQLKMPFVEEAMKDSHGMDTLGSYKTNPLLSDLAQHYAVEGDGFEVWMKKVDRLVSDKLGVGIDDLEDYNFRDAFDAGKSPEAMAKKIVRQQAKGSGMDLGAFGGEEDSKLTFEDYLEHMMSRTTGDGKKNMHIAGAIINFAFDWVGGEAVDDFEGVAKYVDQKVWDEIKYEASQLFLDKLMPYLDASIVVEAGIVEGKDKSSKRLKELLEKEKDIRDELSTVDEWDEGEWYILYKELNKVKKQIQDEEKRMKKSKAGSLSEVFADYKGTLNDFIEARYGVMDSTIYDVAMAYADTIAERFDHEGWVGEANKLRNLDFKGTYVDGETFIDQAKVVGGYNDFNSKIASILVYGVGDKAKFRLGREGSVVVYVKGDLNADKIEDLKASVKADEADYKNGVLRLWWD